jgi:hypothetical protein
MNMAVLLAKLTDIELSIGVATDNALRNMVLDAQDCILAMQRAVVEDLRRESRRQLDRSSRYVA